jgi:hypothetical protein
MAARARARPWCRFLDRSAPLADVPPMVFAVATVIALLFAQDIVDYLNRPS